MLAWTILFWNCRGHQQHTTTLIQPLVAMGRASTPKWLHTGADQPEPAQQTFSPVMWPQTDLESVLDFSALGHQYQTFPVQKTATMVQLGNYGDDSTFLPSGQAFQIPVEYMALPQHILESPEVLPVGHDGVGMTDWNMPMWSTALTSVSSRLNKYQVAGSPCRRH